MSQCCICARVFSFKKNMYQHMRKLHNITPQVPGKICCPLQCDENFRTYNELRFHLDSYHNSKLEKEEYSFSDVASFEIWKAHYEQTSGYVYVRRISEKPLRKGETKSSFICHRSGVFRSESTGRRKLKKGGSNKIGTICPSSMEVTRSLNDGTVKLIFWKTHFAHEADVQRIMTPKRVRKRNSVKVISYPVCVILPAAGVGERMGLNTPKQYVPIHQKPLICYTVEAFLRLTFVKKVIVVASSENLQLMLKTLTESCAVNDDKLVVTEGSGFRHQSIASGVRALKTCCNFKPEIVVIHDGVRPFASEDVVTNVVTAAKEHGAAGVICPLVSTVLSVDDKGFLDHALERDKYKASEMPQAFQYEVISHAYSQCSEHDLEFGTECLHLAQKYGNVKAKLIPGNLNLWKVTHRKDFYAASGVIKENQKVGIFNEGSSTEFTNVLKKHLNKLFHEIQEFKRLKDVSSLSNVPNIVKIYRNKTLKEILMLHENLNEVKTMSQLTTIVHILFQGVDERLNFVDVQKQAKIISNSQRERNFINYYIALESDDKCEEIFENLANTTSSLLFDSNPNLNGTIFLL